MGSVTFAKACEKVIGFTSAHESHIGRINLDYPDNHIEVDPHHFWVAPALLQKYPDAKWVILTRDRDAVIRSLRRASTRNWAAIAFHNANLPLPDIAERLHDFVLGYLPVLLPDAMRLHTPVSPERWADFLEYIGADCEPGAVEILQTVHNATKQPR